MRSATFDIFEWLEEGRWSADLSGSEKASLGLWLRKEQGQIWATNPLSNISQY